MRFHPKSNTGKKKIFVDLGGGSTEFFSRDDPGVEIRSFQLGAVRNMLKKDKKAEWVRMEEWLKTMRPRKKVIGIGGNIRSFLQAFNAKEMDSKNFSKKVKELSGMTTQEKILRFQFSPDRADVIDNAMSIFQFIVTHLDAKIITATKWGVSDSIGVKLFHEIYSNKINIL